MFIARRRVMSQGTKDLEDLTLGPSVVQDGHDLSRCVALPLQVAGQTLEQPALVRARANGGNLGAAPGPTSDKPNSAIAVRHAFQIANYPAMAVGIAHSWCSLQ
jgi:hypothetical protein